MSKNERTWKRLLDDQPIERHIHRNGYYDIHSKQINRLMESRLACKFDFKKQVPKPLSKRNYSVLAINNGVYRIAQTDPFIKLLPACTIDTKDPSYSFTLPSHITTLDSNRINSESKALDCALHSGILKQVFGEDVSLVLRGRERAVEFEFSLPSFAEKTEIPYPINGVQMEVDGGFEGENGIYLIEAKIGTIEENISLRQLIYPQLHYSKILNKPVKSFYLCFDQINLTYHFQYLNFANNGKYKFDKSWTFKIEGNSPCIDEQHFSIDLINVNNELTNVEVPFPQADNFKRIIKTFTTLAFDKSEALEKFELFPAADMNLSSRQFDYYANVLLWLRVAKRNKDGTFSLTPLGKNLALLSTPKIVQEFAKIIFSNDFFNAVWHDPQRKIPATRIIERNNLNPKATTVHRRLQTVKSWIRFFENRPWLNGRSTENLLLKSKELNQEALSF